MDTISEFSDGDTDESRVVPDDAPQEEEIVRMRPRKMMIMVKKRTQKRKMIVRMRPRKMMTIVKNRTQKRKMIVRTRPRKMMMMQLRGTPCL